MRSWLKTALALASCAVVGWSPLSAEAKPKDGQAFGDWVAHCDAAHCWISQRQLLEKSVLLDFAIGTVGATNSEYSAQITVPLGISLQAGVALRLDNGQALPFVMTQCLPHGCQAVMKVDQALLGQLSKAKAINVLMLPQSTKETVNVTVSPKGLAEGLAALK